MCQFNINYISKPPETTCRGPVSTMKTYYHMYKLLFVFIIIIIIILFIII